MKLLNKINGCHSSQYVCESVWRLKMTLYHPLWTITKKFFSLGNAEKIVPNYVLKAIPMMRNI